MSNTTINKGLLVLVVVAVIGFGAYAFAHMGAGTGHQNWMHQGGGMHHYGYGIPGLGYSGDLSDAERKALDEERQAYFDSTEGLRGDIYAKQLELRSELAKDKSDPQKALALQSKISELVARLDQKHLGHMIKMRKINPHAGRGYMGGYHKGYGNSSFDSCWR